VSQSQDSRGPIIRCLSDIRAKDPKAKLKLSYCDLSLDNIRDLVRHVKKERIKS